MLDRGCLVARAKSGIHRNGIQYAEHNHAWHSRDRLVDTRALCYTPTLLCARTGGFSFCFFCSLGKRSFDLTTARNSVERRTSAGR